MTGIQEPNFKPKTIWTGDNLPIMRGMNSACVDLIYLDPPFNSKANYAAPIGSKAAGAEFKDTWTLDDIDDEWINSIAEQHPSLYQVILAAMTDSDKSYLAYMAQRLLEMERILKDTGSIYLHCDPTMSHSLKLVMDAIFGRKNFRNEIIWCYTGPGSPKMRQFNRKHDNIFWYSKGEIWTFNKEAARVPYKDPKQRPRKVFDTGGAFDMEAIKEMRAKGKILETWWDDIALAVRSKKERTGYPTQKPLKLLKRIIEASSNKNDIVFDPFCGCATTLVAAEGLNHPRNWIGIDISPKAAELVIDRIREARGMFEDIKARDDIPQRTDLGKLPSPRSHLEYLYGVQDACCKGCGEYQRKGNLEVDHIYPKSKGGTDHLSNLQLLCGNCNSIKGNRSMEYLTLRRNQTKEILRMASW